MKNDEFYTTNNPKSFKDQLFDLLKKSPNNLPNKSFFGKEKNPLIRYLLECFVKVDLEKEKINSINVLKEKIFWHPNGIKEFDKGLFMQEDSDLEDKFTDNSLIITCEKCFNANQNLLYKIQRMEEEIKSLNKKIKQIKIIGENLISVCSKEYMP